MEYPFKLVEREIFPKTFLKDVRVILFYPEVEQGSIDAGKLSLFYSQFKGVTVSIEKIKEGIELTSDDESIKLRFSLRFVEVLLRTPSYKTFDLALQFISLLKGYFEAMEIKTINKLVISKYNELRFQHPSAEYTIQKIMKGVYSEALIQRVLSGKEVLKDLTRWEKELKFDNTDETDTLFTIECGFSRKSVNGLNGILALTTRVETSKNPFGIKDLASKTEMYNVILDSAFRWCVRNEIIEKMRVKI